MSTPAEASAELFESVLASGEVSTEQLVTQRFTLETAADAYDALARGEITGRAMVVVDAGLV